MFYFSARTQVSALTLTVLFTLSVPIHRNRKVLTPNAQSPTAQSIARSVEERYARATTLQASFLERYSRGAGDLTVESGTVYFSRPGRMRWEYESPEEKLFLADGRHVWFFVPADKTATRAKTKESADWHTPLALLAGKTRKGLFNRMCATIELVGAGLSRPNSNAGTPSPSPAPDQAFTLRVPATAGTEGSFAIRCTPKGKNASFSDLLLESDQAYRIVRLLIREPGGIETEFRFGNWKENPPLPETLFHFQTPPGVAIVEESSIPPPEPRRKP